MVWFYKDDKTKPVFSSKMQVQSEHRRTEIIELPKTAILLYMSGIDFIVEKYNAELISSNFPRFLNKTPIYKIKGANNICLLDGGRGAPMAADTIETLHSFGVENVISMGLIGGFVEGINIGDIVMANKAYVEEGTSLHYYETIEYSTPDAKLFEQLTSRLKNYKVAPIISCDAIYRQTFYKEKLWREKGCVGVDMETSALFSVGNYLDLHIVSVLMVSDVHPIYEGQDNWKWKMTDELRKQFLYQIIDIVLSL